MADELEGALAVLVFASIVVVAGPTAVRLWRDDSAVFKDSAALARLGKPPAARALRRLFPVTILAFAVLTLAFAVRVADGAVDVFGGLMLLAAICELCGVLIVLVNRPKMLVPPHLRGEPGYVSDRRRHHADVAHERSE